MHGSKERRKISWAKIEPVVFRALAGLALVAVTTFSTLGVVNEVKTLKGEKVEIGPLGPENYEIIVEWKMRNDSNTHCDALFHYTLDNRVIRTTKAVNVDSRALDKIKEVEEGRLEEIVKYLRTEE